jgi:hypothetical protein
MKRPQLIIKILIVASVLVLVILGSCTEEELNEFNGNVTDMSSGNVVEGVRVILYASTVNSGSISSAFVQVAETTTDANGDYLLECENDAYLKFRLKFEKDGYHSYSSDFDPTDQIGLYVQDFFLARESYLYVRILNTLPYAEEDQFKLRIEGINEECTTCASGEYHYFYGALTDTSLLFNIVGGDSIRLHSISIHNDDSQIRDNNVFCIPGDTVFFNCYY